MTDDEVVEALRIVARSGALPPPAAPEAVAAGEEAIGVWPQGVNLAEWLTGTLAGALTVDTVLESQPTS